MNKEEKLKFQKQVQSYLQRKRVYDTFQDLLKLLLIHKPDNPIDFLIDKLEKPQPKKIFIVGPKGSDAKKKALTVASMQRVKYETISISDVLKNQVSKKTPLGQKISKYTTKGQMVSDDIVIELAKKTIEEHLKSHKNIIVQGFPKTRIQGLAMQKAGIIPDSFMILNISKNHFMEAVKSSTQKTDRFTADQKVLEYQLNISQVKDIYKKFYFEIDCSQSHEKACQEIARLLRFRLASSGPKGAINILLIRPPGRTWKVLGKAIHQKYGFVYLSVQEMVSQQIAKKTQVGKLALKLETQGDPFPDEIINGLMMNRFNQVDCYLQGSVIDGFPQTETQIGSLQQMKVHPNLVILLDVKTDYVTQLLKTERIDPQTGQFYNHKSFAPSGVVRDRLVKGIDVSNNAVIQKRVDRWIRVCKQVQKRFQSSKIQKLYVKESQNFDIQVNSMLEKIGFKLQKGL